MLRRRAHRACAPAALAALAHLFCVLPASAQAPAAAPATPASLGAGPFRVGMSLDEVRAAAPQIEWRNLMVSKFTGRVFSMRSDDTFAIAGIEFEIEAMAHYYEHRLLLEAVTEAADAAACERAGLDALAAIEPQAGPFTSHAPVTTPATGGGLYWQTQRSANGSIIVMPSPAAGTSARTDGETVDFGRGSTALVDAFDDQYRPRPRVKRFGAAPAFMQIKAHNRGDWFDVQAEVNYGRDGGSNCSVRVDIKRWTQPPLPQPFDTTRATVRREASIAERHLLHSPLAVPSGPAQDIELACEVNRQTGWVSRCGGARPDDISPEQERVALNLTRLIEYDMSDVDRDDPQIMRGTVRVRVDPAARRPTDFLAAPRTPVAEIEFTEQPDPEAGRLVPPVLGGDEGNAVEVTLTCRVESDGSLICIDPDAATEPERKAVVATAIRVAATGYRVAPTLRGGAPSVARVFDLAVEVRRAF